MSGVWRTGEGDTKGAYLLASQAMGTVEGVGPQQERVDGVPRLHRRAPVQGVPEQLLQAAPEPPQVVQWPAVDQHLLQGAHEPGSSKPHSDESALATALTTLAVCSALYRECVYIMLTRWMRAFSGCPKPAVALMARAWAAARCTSAALEPL